MDNLQEIINRYNIGNSGERVSFMHSGIANTAFSEIKNKVTETTTISESQYNWLVRLGECTRDAGIWAAVRHLDGGCGYQFVPSVL